MGKIFDALLNMNARDYLGLFLWLCLSMLTYAVIGWLGITLCVVAMVAREIYQWQHYHLSSFEWEDVVRYALVILLGWGLSAIRIVF